jgi:hypothetical protein
MPPLITPSGASGILSIGSSLFTAIKPLFFILIAVFLGLALLDFLLGLFSNRPSIEKHIVITENRAINSALDKISLKYQEYRSLAKTLKIPLTRRDRLDLKRLEEADRKEILTERFNQLKAEIYRTDNKKTKD